MKDLLDLVVFDSASAWALLAFTLAGLVVIPRLFGIRLLNGLLFAQITLFFNAYTIIGGLDTGRISPTLGIHFFSVEFGFLALIYATYARLLRVRETILAALNRFFSGPGAVVLVGFIAIIAAFNFIVTPTDGSSRIEYMTGAWFSLVKPFIQLATPISYVGVFILLLNPRRRRLGYVLLLASVLSNVLTGSKASFAFSLLSAFFALRDLAGLRLRIRGRDKLAMSVFIAAMSLLALARLNVSADDVRDRFFLFGEANILTYFSDKPTAACANLSTFAKMHRGWARLAGDSSANDIDTLFGYALMIEATGINTFTGPNARLSAYALCNFPGGQIVLCVVVVLGYLGLLLAVHRRALRRPILCAFAYPFALVSLAGAAQDFNLIMQDITIFVLLLLVPLPFQYRLTHKLG